MADQVQAVLDRMVPALKDLLDKGVFSESEIKAITSRRRESEYLINRRIVRQSDFSRYIEAEKNLEKLRKLRNKRVLARLDAKEREEQKKSSTDPPTKRKFKFSIGDASIVQHIHLLYVRAKRKWQQDLTWHLQHAEFAKEAKSFSMLSKIYAEALQIHPRNTGLWIEAASLEYFGCVTDNETGEISGGGSIKSARVMLQRALRVNPSAKDLWLQSFCLEFHYIQKLRGRRELLQLGLKRPRTAEDVSGDDEEEAADIEAFYEDAKLPRIIYKNAIKAIPSSVTFRLQFIDQCRLFPQTQTMIDDIMSSIESDFGHVEEAWIARANVATSRSGDEESINIGFFKSPTYDNASDSESSKKRKRAELSDGEAHYNVKAMQILDEATDAIHTPTMFLESIRFARAYIHQLTENMEERELSQRTKIMIMDIASFLRKVVNKGNDNDIISPELAIEFTTVLTELGSPSEALDFIERVTREDGQCRTSAQCWLKRAEMKTRVDRSIGSSSKVLRQALKYIPLHDKGHWDLLSKLFLNLLTQSSSKRSASLEKEIASTYDKLVLLSHHKEDSSKANTIAASLPALSSAYISSKCDLDITRKVYNKILFSSNFAKTGDKSQEEVADMRIFLDQCLVAEKVIWKEGDGGVGKQQHRRQLARMYDAAIHFFHKNGYSGIADAFTKNKNKDIFE